MKKKRRDQNGPPGRRVIASENTMNAKPGPLKTYNKTTKVMLIHYNQLCIKKKKTAIL